MGEELVGLCLTSFAIWLGVTIFIKIINFIRKRFLVSQMPTEEELGSYVSIIKNMREQGAGYHQQLSFLQQSGVNKKIAEIIIAKIEADEI